MLAEIRLERDAPVWRHPIDCASLGWVCPERELGVLGERAVTRQFEIEQIVDQSVAAEAYNTLRNAPSIKVLAAGAGAKSELMKWKRQTGVVFQTSCTVGLLWSVKHHSRS